MPSQEDRLRRLIQIAQHSPFPWLADDLEIAIEAESGPESYNRKVQAALGAWERALIQPFEMYREAESQLGEILGSEISLLVIDGPEGPVKPMYSEHAEQAIKEMRALLPRIRNWLLDQED